MHGYLKVRPALLLAVLLAAIPPFETPVFAQSRLVDHVAAYLRSTDENRRTQILEQIESSQGYLVAALQRAVLNVNVWSQPNSSDIRFVLPSDGHEATDVYVRLPERYSTRRRWPLIVALHGVGDSAANMLRLTRALAGSQAEDFIIAAPEALQGAWFQGPADAVSQPLQLLIELRKRFRVDSDRVYLIGYSKGAHESCLLALMTADRWAAVIPLAGTMILPHPAITYPDLLPNLRHLPVLLCWGQHDIHASGGRASPTGGIAGANHKLASFARIAEVPLTPVELSGLGHGGVKPPADKLRDLLNKPRTKHPAQVSHRFRFQAHARAYWLASTRFLGTPWTDTRLMVKVKTGEDHNKAIREALHERLGYLSGRIDGQTITIRTRHVAQAELLLNADMLSLDKPVRVIFNGRRVFDGRLHPRGQVLLETVAADYDFQRLFTARLRIPYEGKARED